MNILLISKRLGCSTCVTLGNRGIFLIAVTAFLVIPLLTLYGGYQIGVGRAPSPNELSAQLQRELTEQQQTILEAKRGAEENLNALTLRMGQLQAHVIRLDALGQRLTRMAGLEDGEFDFADPPAQGGPEGGAQESMGVPDFLSQLDALELQLKDRTQQLSVLESMIMNRNLQAEVVPAGRPIEKGWLSSKYGQRADPFTGKLDFHEGVDLAGKEGSAVLAVASGVVTWAGKRYGYGNLVEINHGNGYSTRYGHCKDVLVKVGDTVKKGESVATMGSTGRSTGPHVHFEVRYNGRTVDPKTYMQASR